MALQLKFQLPFPPSVNSMYRFHGKKMYMVCEARKYKWAVQYFLATIKPPKFDDSAKIELRMSLQPSLDKNASGPKNRPFDNDNRAKALLDAMQDYGLFKNDHQIHRLIIEKLPPIEHGDAYVDVVLTEML